MWSSGELQGQWAADGFLVQNNVWNVKEAGPQRIDVWSPHRWSVTANHSRLDVRPGSIKSYACTRKDFTNRSIDSFTDLSSSWATTYPAVGEFNGAFDIWVGGVGSKCTAELMLWTNHRYNGPLPPSNATESVKVDIDGQGFTAWRRPLNAGDSRWYIALAMNPMQPAGSLDLLAVFRWLVGKGWLKGTDTIAAVEYGIELANTVGEERTYSLDDYQLSFK